MVAARLVRVMLEHEGVIGLLDGTNIVLVILQTQYLVMVDERGRYYVGYNEL